MELRPGYKQTEVGVIPEEWETVKAGEVGRFRGGNGFPTRFQGATSGDYPFYKVSDMNNEGNETFMFDSNNWISEGVRKHLGATAFPAHSIIFAKVGAAIFLERKKILTKPSCIDNNLAALVLNSARTDVRFVHYCLLDIRLSAFVSTTALPSLSGSVLSQIPFALPSLPEQRAIAGALGDADALIGALEKLIAKKHDLKQAAMQQLLTGQTRLPGFSGEWEVKPVAELGEVVTGGTPRTDVKEFWGGEFPWITPTDISSHRDMFTSERSLTLKGLNAIRKLPADTVLVTCIASIGKNAILKTKGGCNQQINAVVPNKNNKPEFLYYLFEASKQYLLANAGITATSIISKATFEELAFTVPLLTEQADIVAVLSEIDAEIAALEQRLVKTRALKQGMMQELLTGRTRLV